MNTDAYTVNVDYGSVIRSAEAYIISFFSADGVNSELGFVNLLCISRRSAVVRESNFFTVKGEFFKLNALGYSLSFGSVILHKGSVIFARLL